MNALIRKDLRLLRPIVIASAIAAVGLYVVLPIAEQLIRYVDPDRQREHHPSQEDLRLLLDTLLGGTIGMWLVATLFAAIVSGMSFALERRETWADFAAMMPIHRARIIFSKLLTACVFFVAFILINGLVTVLAACALLTVNPYEDFHVYGFRENLCVSLSVGLAMFGAGWLASTLLRSPVVAMALSIGAIGGTALVALQHIAQVDRSAPLLLIPILLGLVMTGVGTVIQLKRQSP